MRVIERRFLAAGNLYGDRAVVCLGIDMSAEDVVQDWVAAWARVVAALPDLGSRGDDLLRHPGLREPVPLAAGNVHMRCIETLALALQRSVYWPVSFAPGDTGGEAVFEAKLPYVGFTAGETAVDIMNDAASGKGRKALRKRIERSFAEFGRRAMRVTPALSAMLIARAANERGVPWFVIPGTKILQLGQGRYQQRVRDSVTTETGIIATRLALNKANSFTVLRKAGIPVADQFVARSVGGALRAARRIGFPVVIKPLRGNKGEGVTVNVDSEDKARAAFELATRKENTAVVEAMTPGEEYRLLVVGGRFVAASCRRPASVIGDGRRTIRELIEDENRNPDRSAFGLVNFLSPLKADEVTEDVVASQGLTLASVPAPDQSVWLRRISNVSQGGTAEDRTEDIHPANRRMAERAAAALRLDLCGVDFITPDPRRPYWEAGGAICEVNSRPGLRLHSGVMRGTRRPVETDVVGMLFRERPEGRIPFVAILSRERGTALPFAMAARFADAGLAAGVWAGGTLYVGDRDPVAKIEDALAGVEALVCDATLDAAVVQLAPSDVREKGAGVDRIDVLFVDPGCAADIDEAAALEKVTTGGVFRRTDASAVRAAAQAMKLPASGAAKRPRDGA